MSDGATNGNGNGKNAMLILRWVGGIATALLTLALAGLATWLVTSVLGNQERIAKLETILPSGTTDRYTGSRARDDWQQQHMRDDKQDDRIVRLEDRGEK